MYYWYYYHNCVGLCVFSSLLCVFVLYHSDGTLTDPLVWFRRAGGELEHVGSLLLQPPAVQDLPVALLKVIKLQHMGGVQEPGVTTQGYGPHGALTTGLGTPRGPQDTALRTPRGPHHRVNKEGITSCSCRAAPVLVLAGPSRPGCRSDSHQVTTRPKDPHAQSPGLLLGAMKYIPLNHHGDLADPIQTSNNTPSVVNPML